MNNIGIRSISSLSGLKSRIPEYQRGYRWREKQATQLLEDIREFYKRDRKTKGEFYYMQPIGSFYKVGFNNLIMFQE